MKKSFCALRELSIVCSIMVLVSCSNPEKKKYEKACPELCGPIKSITEFSDPLYLTDKIIPFETIDRDSLRVYHTELDKNGNEIFHSSVYDGDTILLYTCKYSDKNRIMHKKYWDVEEGKRQLEEEYQYNDLGLLEEFREFYVDDSTKNGKLHIEDKYSYSDSLLLKKTEYMDGYEYRIVSEYTYKNKLPEKKFMYAENIDNNTAVKDSLYLATYIHDEKGVIIKIHDDYFSSLHDLIVSEEENPLVKNKIIEISYVNDPYMLFKKEYDEQGNIIKQIENDMFKYRYEYDNEGKLIKEWEFHRGKIFVKTTYKYRNDILRKKTKERYNEGSKYSHNEYFYFKNGLMEKYKTKNSKPTIFEYDIDARGNLIAEREFVQAKYIYFLGQQVADTEKGYFYSSQTYRKIQYYAD
ncbi:MAG: YD repeat-containing protein [Flavobacteriaceae bacterium]|nr:YD repeat-containing protein [Flavobacteriaceae bacterium]